MDNNFELIVSIVNRGFSDAVVDGARKSGAKGGTIIYGRGTSSYEKDSILGVSIQPEKELILTLTATEKRNEIMKSICENADIDKQGMGICFSLPVNQVRGFNYVKEEKTEENLKK